MKPNNNYVDIWFVLMLLISKSSSLPYNQPIFCANASWNPNPATLADSSIIGSDVKDIFVTTNNSIYVANGNKKQILVLPNINSPLIRNLSSNSSSVLSIFVTEATDVYFSYLSNSIDVIPKFISNFTNSTSVMETCWRCYDIVIDIHNNIYCSANEKHEIIKKSLNNISDSVRIVAGTGVSGSTSYMLNTPLGVFVDTNFDLYVADCLNDRIQLFLLDQLNGITIAGNGSANKPITLYHPTEVTLDGNKDLFIVDYGNRRIVKSGSNGFQCLVGCNGSGSAQNQLSYFRSASFDSFGNLFVVDSSNYRIQKFNLISNICNQTTTSIISTMRNSSINRTNLATVNTSSNEISHNRPKLDPLTVWNPNAITFANGITIGTKPFGIFVNKNNTVYVPGRNTNKIQIWMNENVNLTTAINTSVLSHNSIFVTSNGDIYTISGASPYEINRWTLNSNHSDVVAYTNAQSYGIFVDINNTLYFSQRDQHRVMTRSLISTSNTLTIIAGTGCSGNAMDMLDRPHGMFVDDNFDLYVTDSGNNRIQLYRSGSRNIKSVAGTGSVHAAFKLNYPVSVILDADKHLFIAEYDTHRIVGSGPHGFRCIVGCTELSGSTSNTLTRPVTIAFDSYGNIFVADEDNNRIQKFIRLNNTALVPSYNQPTFCVNATWDANATTFAHNSSSYTLFITTNNTIYSAGNDNGRIRIWLNDSTVPVLTLYGNLSTSGSIFVTQNGDIYVDNGRIEKFTLNSNKSVTVMSVASRCYGLFVDISNTLYCSDVSNHQVVKKWLGDNLITGTRVAGNGSAGSASHMLSLPRGIFVDTNFDLYVADSGNNRIQLFPLGQSNGITINTTISLNLPRNVILDGNKYLYIADYGNHRIIGEGPFGFRCIVGCSGSSGSTADKLNYPRSLAFDSFGNLFVSDQGNDRIQKFSSLSNLCATTINCTPVVTLIPSGSSVYNPLQFRRSQDFSIISMINYDCNQTLSFTFQWIIRNCTTSCLQSIPTTFNELFIPARTLPYGIYEFELQTNIHVNGSFQSTISKFVYVQITPSGLTPNLIQFGTSMVTSGYQQDLTLNPGKYSMDHDENIFNSSDWTYKYYCRILSLSIFPNINGTLLEIHDLRNDSSNPSCLSNRTGWSYKNSLKSSITIHSESLQPNQTYQFMVYMENRRNNSRQATGYVSVKVEDTHPQLIAIGCVIWTLCVPNLEYQLVNPTTQIALYTICNGNCTNIQNIIWNIYSGEMNSSTNISQWTLFNHTNSYENIWFFGRNTSNFTAMNQLFLSNPAIQRWKFEVIYTFPTETTISSVNFIINQPPQNGSCTISLRNGTTSTIFTISCDNWFDEDGIEDYSTYVWTTDPSNKLFIGSSSVPVYEVRLPSGLLNLMISIRDQLNCVTEYDLSSITVETENLIHNQTNTDSIIRLLTVGNQNTIGQVLTSISQQFNQISNETIQQTVSNGIPAASISVSSLNSQRLSKTNESNQLTMIEFEKELNSLATLRESLIPFVTNLPITTSNSIKLQASTLAQLTQTTNQLTRQSLTIVSEKCYQLSLALYSMSSKLSYEDVQTTATSLIQCATNVLTAVNGPLQKRTTILKVDVSRGTAFPVDYDTDLESEWSKFNLIVNGNTYYQKQTAQQISKQVNEIISKLTSILNIHLNIGQKLTIDTPESFMSLETQSISSLTNKQVKQIRLPSTIHTNLSNQTTVSIRSIMQPLALFADAKSWTSTNLSRTVSLSIFDQHGNEVSIRANDTHPIEIIIPRDPNLPIPPMTFQNVNVTSFHLHYVNLTNHLSSSVHIEIRPTNANLSYLLIYKFDGIPQMNRSDGSAILSPSNYTYFLDNQQTQNHHSIVFGLRELNSTNISSNYELRIYSSCCVYLDEHNQWSAEGLRVGPLTNYEQTQCFSTHLTTFAGGFIVLPEPLNWEYVFANADFMQNRTIYLTVICVTVIYLMLMIYARFQDRKDLEKIGVTQLADNRISDEYVYQIIVFTGHRKGSSTDSHVQFILAGDAGETRIRTFSDSKRKIFQNGGIDIFLMSVSKSLGSLNYFHIWHDNSGQGSSASWFLKYIIVKDLQTMETSHFICQKWFAVDKDDGRIERVLPIATAIEKNQFTYLLSKQAYHNVSDGHLWFSIFSRPPSNQFTRVQRCTCCFVLFLLSMFLNIMYYDLSNQVQNHKRQISIGITIEVLALIPSLLLVQLFRRLRPRETHQMKKKFTLPWWFIFLAYGLCVILASVSIFFIIARGIEFGDEKSQQWLTSILTGFFSSIFLTQPIKIISLAIFFVCFCRQSNHDDDEHIEIQQKSYSTYDPTIQSNRLTEHEIVYARNQRFKEIQMWSFLHETLISLIFLALLFVVTYSNRTMNPSLQVQHLQKYFQSKQISTIDEYWNWLNNNFTRNLRAQRWYNGNQPRNLSGFIDDKTNRLLGWATMRQLRVKSSLCSYQKFDLTCEDDFHRSNEETNSFEFGWQNETTVRLNSTLARAFQYQTKHELDSYSITGDHGNYPGGGYVYEFRGRFVDLQTNLSVLHQAKWIDSQTRAVIIQLSLYNPNVQLFTSVIVLTEFLSTGGLQIQIRIEPININLFITSISHLICTIFYMILIFYFMFTEIRSLFRLKRKYFQQVWPLIEFGLIVCSWMGVVLYICQYRECSRISQLFSETNGYVYINLQYLTYLNDFLTFMYAFCCFFATMKLIRLFRFNSRIDLFISTLQLSAKELVGFSFMFSIVFCAHLCLFYLLFSSKILLVKFDAYQLIAADAFWGPFTYALFIFFVVFICMSFFLAIIIGNFRRAKANQLKNNKEDMYAFIWRRFLRWIGWRNKDDDDEMMRVQLLSSFDVFSKRIDQLLEALDRIYHDQIK